MSRFIACPNSNYKGSSISNNNSNDLARIFIIGGYIEENGSKDIRAVNWNLEYIKDPCFI